MAEARQSEGINGADESSTTTTATSGGGAQKRWVHGERETLQGVLHRIMSTIFFPVDGGSAPPPFVRRVKTSLSDNLPLLKEASADTGRKLLLWARRGSPLRALLVISVGLDFSGLSGW